MTFQAHRRSGLWFVFLLCLGWCSSNQHVFAQAETEKRSFDVSEGYAINTLKEAAQQAEVEFIFSADLVNGVRTLSIQGEYTPQEAFSLMLAETSIKVFQHEKTGVYAITKVSEIINKEPETNPNQETEMNVKKNDWIKTLTAIVTLGLMTDQAIGQEDTVYELSPFEIDESTEIGYLSTNTLAGTRFNTELKDTPIAISVFTPEFLQDIGTTELKDSLAYGLSTDIDQLDFTGNGTQTSDVSIKMRGLRRASLGRNFFEWNLSSDVYNVARYTFTRGPNAVIFGIGGPGGIIDTTTKRAQFTNMSSGTVRFGSYDDVRFTADVNRQVTDRLAIRVNAVWQERDGNREWEFHRRKGAALALTYKLTDTMTFRFDGEYGEVDEVEAMPWAAFDFVTPWLNADSPISEIFGDEVEGTVNQNSGQYYVIQNTGQVLQLTGAKNTVAPPGGTTSGNRVNLINESILPKSTYLAGPSARSPNEFHSLGFFLEQRIGDSLVIEAAFNRQVDKRIWFRPMNWGDIALRADPNAQLPDGTPNPFVGQYYVDTSRVEITDNDKENDDYRLSVSYEFDLGEVFGSHQIAGMWARRDEKDFDSYWREANITGSNPSYRSGNNRIAQRTYVSFEEGSPLPRAYQNPYGPGAAINNVNGVTSKFYAEDLDNEILRLDSALFAMQSSFWGGRVFTTVGLRDDKQISRGTDLTRDPVTGESLSAVRSDSASEITGNTETYGLVFHATPWFSLFGNKANNFAPQGRDTFQLDGRTIREALGSREGDGKDFGIKLNLLEGRISGTAAYFETVEKNAFKNKTGFYEFSFEGITQALGESTWGQGDDSTDQESTGYEFEIVSNITDNWRMFFNYSDTDIVEANTFPRMSAYINENLDKWRANADLEIPGNFGAGVGEGNLATIGAVTDAVLNQLAFDKSGEGKSPFHHRQVAANFYTKYKIAEGGLKGVSFGLGANHRGSMVVGYEDNGDTIELGSFTLFNVMVGFERSFRLAGKEIDWSIQLNLDNAFDEDDLVPTEAGPSGNVFRYSYQRPRTWSLTQRFSF